LVRLISLHEDLSRSQHCIELSNDRFLVSNIDEQHLVCIVNANKEILKSCGRPSGSEFKLNKPRHMAVDKHGNILVVDESNKRVEVFYPNLQHRDTLLIDGEQLNGPRAICLHEQDHRHYIGAINSLVVLEASPT